MFTVVAAVTFELRGFEFDVVSFIVTFVLSLVLIVVPVLLKRWYYVRRRLKINEITAEYVPPLGLSPAEISYLFNSKLQERVVAATAIDLVHRGLMTAKKVEGSKRYFVGPRVDSKLKGHEKMLIQQVDVEGGISGSELVSGLVSFGAKDGIGGGVKKPVAMRQFIKKDLVAHGYVRGSYTRQIIYRTLKLSLFLALTLVWLPLSVAIALSMIAKGSSTFADVGGFLLIAIVVSLISLIPMVFVSTLLNASRGRMTGRDWAITPKLGRLWLQIVGFRQYVELSERGKLRYRTDKLKKLSKNDVLPYSVALGFVKNWRDIIN